MPAIKPLAVFSVNPGNPDDLKGVINKFNHQFSNVGSGQPKAWMIPVSSNRIGVFGEIKEEQLRDFEQSLQGREKIGFKRDLQSESSAGSQATSFDWLLKQVSDLTSENNRMRQEKLTFAQDTGKMQKAVADAESLAEMAIKENDALKAQLKEKDRLHVEEMNGLFPMPDSSYDAQMIVLCTFSSKAKELKPTQSLSPATTSSESVSLDSDSEKAGGIPLFVMLRESTDRYVLCIYLPLQEEKTPLHDLLSVKNIFGGLRDRLKITRKLDDTFCIEYYEATFPKEEYKSELPTILVSLCETIRGKLNRKSRETFGMSIDPIYDKAFVSTLVSMLCALQTAVPAEQKPQGEIVHRNEGQVEQVLDSIKDILRATGPRQPIEVIRLGLKIKGIVLNDDNIKSYMRKLTDKGEVIKEGATTDSVYSLAEQWESVKDVAYKSRERERGQDGTFKRSQDEKEKVLETIKEVLREKGPKQSIAVIVLGLKEKGIFMTAQNLRMRYLVKLIPKEVMVEGQKNKPLYSLVSQAPGQ